MKKILAGIFALTLLSTEAYSQKVVASWYGLGFHGRKTASGETFNQWAMTASHKHFKFGTRLKLTYKGRTVIVRINDRGPFIKGRHLDLSRGAANKLGCKGVCVINMEVL